MVTARHVINITGMEAVESVMGLDGNTWESNTNSARADPSQLSSLNRQLARKGRYVRGTVKCYYHL